MTVVGLNYGLAGQMKVDETTRRRTLRSDDDRRARRAAAAERERACRRPVPGTRHRGDRRETPRLNDAIRTRQGAAASAAQSSGTGAGSVEEKAEDQDGMEQAEHDLLADLRRARRSLRLQGMDQPPAVARLTLGQRIADAVATVMDRGVSSSSRARSCSSG